jgi:hypothetical protein
MTLRLEFLESCQLSRAKLESSPRSMAPATTPANSKIFRKFLKIFSPTPPSIYMRGSRPRQTRASRSS